MYLQIKKNKNSKQFYIVESFRKSDGSTSSRVVEKLGNLEDVTSKAGGMDPEKWARERAARLTIEAREKNKDISVLLSNSKTINKDKDNLFNVGYLHIQSILHKLNLHQTIKSLSEDTKIEDDLSNIYLDLIYGRILYPSSKRSTFEETRNLLKSHKYDLQHVYRSLDILAENSDYIQ